MPLSPTYALPNKASPKTFSYIMLLLKQASQLDQVGRGLRAADQLVDVHDLDLGHLECVAEGEAADAAEAVDADLDHYFACAALVVSEAAIPAQAPTALGADGQGLNHPSDEAKPLHVFSSDHVSKLRGLARPAYGLARAVLPSFAV